jgi:hypothetical protein
VSDSVIFGPTLFCGVSTTVAVGLDPEVAPVYLHIHAPAVLRQNRLHFLLANAPAAL